MNKFYSNRLIVDQYSERVGYQSVTGCRRKQRIAIGCKTSRSTWILKTGGKVVAAAGQRVKTTAMRTEKIGDKSIMAVPVPIAAIIHIGQQFFDTAKWTFRFLVSRINGFQFLKNRNNEWIEQLAATKSSVRIQNRICTMTTYAKPMRRSQKSTERWCA